MTYVPKWATCERCKTFRPRSEMVRDRHRIRRWTCKSCPCEALDSGSNDNPHESDGTPPEACTYCGDVWPCAGSQNGSDPSPERHK